MQTSSEQSSSNTHHHSSTSTVGVLSHGVSIQAVCLVSQCQRQELLPTPAAPVLAVAAAVLSVLSIEAIPTG
jgi:hypothetical protein